MSPRPPYLRVVSVQGCFGLNDDKLFSFFRGPGHFSEVDDPLLSDLDIVLGRRYQDTVIHDSFVTLLRTDGGSDLDPETVTTL